LKTQDCKCFSVSTLLKLRCKKVFMILVFGIVISTTLPGITNTGRGAGVITREQIEADRRQRNPE